MLKGIGVIGAGGWGIALASMLADKGEPTTLWCHGAENYRELTEHRESRSYLPGIVLPSSIQVTRSLDSAASGKVLVICAVPSHAAPAVMAQAAAYVAPESIILCGTKGLVEESLKTMGEMLTDVF